MEENLRISNKSDNGMEPNHATKKPAEVSSSASRER